MKLREFIASGDDYNRRAHARGGQDGYFRQHASRLHHACEAFRLFDARLGEVLEIGPFYGCTPFLLRPRSSSYTVLEGPDPAVQPLESLYSETGIRMLYADFFEVFGPTRTAPHRLDFPDAQFDTVLCWETMEHFNFNPVKFVRELRRVLKPGGRACITVPNKASFQSLAGLLSGRGEDQLIRNYFQFEDYVSDGKTAFYGFHWREYSPRELGALFAGAGFHVEECRSFTAFQDHGRTGLVRRLARAGNRIAVRLFPRHGTHVMLSARKTSQ